MRPVVIAVAITGSVPRKKDTPAIPVTASEQIESTHEAFEAGAALVHLHVRDETENSSSDPEQFRRVLEGIRRHCPGMIVQFSTGGRGRDQGARAAALPLRPDMASLATGSVNFPSIVYENLRRWSKTWPRRCSNTGSFRDRDLRPVAYPCDAAPGGDGPAQRQPHVQFVLGIKNAMPAREHLVDLLLGELKRVLPKATWTAAGIGRHQER